ncbi:MAG: ComEC/Rec2 family competence protein [Patescibacteria group bacterium]
MSSKILWALIGGFLAGVFVRSFIALSWPFAAFLILLAAASLAYIFIDKEKKSALIIVAILFAAFAGGMVRMDGAGQTGDEGLTFVIGEKVTITGTVFEEPDVRENGIRLSVRVTELAVANATSTSLSTGTTSVSAGVLVLAPPHSDVSYGDVVRATGTLKLPEAFDTGAGRTFNYPQYLAKNGILYMLSFAQVERIGQGEKNYLKVAALRTKHLYLHGLQAVLPEPESGLAGGITVGDKRGVGEEYSDIFIAVGLIHIIVLSGYNITIVMSMAGKLLGGMPRAAQVASNAFIVIFIVLMAGAAPSAMRAGAMALLPLIARMTGRIYLALRALGVVALVMVVWNPLLLAYDPGFQLSVLATLGLVLLSPVCAGWLHWIPERFALREIAASTLGTQAMVLPLLLYQNGLLSLVALPANLLALVAVPWAMGLSVVAAFAGMILGPYAVVIAFPAYVILAYIIGVAQFFAALPFASVSVTAFSVWWMFAAYALLFGGVWYVQKRKSRTQGPAVSKK